MPPKKRPKTDSSSSLVAHPQLSPPCGGFDSASAKSVIDDVTVNNNSKSQEATESPEKASFNAENTNHSRSNVNNDAGSREFIETKTIEAKETTVPVSTEATSAETTTDGAAAVLPNAVSRVPTTPLVVERIKIGKCNNAHPCEHRVTLTFSDDTKSYRTINSRDIPSLFAKHGHEMNSRERQHFHDHAHSKTAHATNVNATIGIEVATDPIATATATIAAITTECA